MRFPFAFVLIAALFGSNCAPARADAAGETKAVEDLFAAQKLDPAAFTPAWLSKVPLDGMQSFIDSYKARLGYPLRYDRDGTQLRIVSKNGSIGCDVALDQQGKISDLLFHDEMSDPDLKALSAVLSAPKADPALFEKSFAADVPTTRVDQLISSYRKKFGDFVRIDSRKRGYFVVFAKGEAHAQISVTGDGMIDYLALSPV